MTSLDLSLDAREVPLGGVRGITVHRTLPHRGLPTVGPWCFVDHFGPTTERMNVLPHPHTGLQTVTWPLAGENPPPRQSGQRCRAQARRAQPHDVGRRVAHSEFSVGDEDNPMHGLQLWVALPNLRRTGVAGFEHHPDLPVAEGKNWVAKVLMGELDGAASPATTYSPMVGAELSVRPGERSSLCGPSSSTQSSPSTARRWSPAPRSCTDRCDTSHPAATRSRCSCRPRRRSC